MFFVPPPLSPSFPFSLASPFRPFFLPASFPSPPPSHLTKHILELESGRRELFPPPQYKKLDLKRRTAGKHLLECPPKFFPHYRCTQYTTGGGGKTLEEKGGRPGNRKSASDFAPFSTKPPQPLGSPNASNTVLYKTSTELAFVWLRRMGGSRDKGLVKPRYNSTTTILLSGTEITIL